MRYQRTTKCPYCEHEFEYEEEEQVPGFRIKDSLICPKCQKVIKTSMEVEFYV